MCIFRNYSYLLAAALILCGLTSVARAQSSSLFRQAGGVPPSALVVANSSWMFEPVAPPREFKLGDRVTVFVARASEAASRKQTQLDIDLANFIRLKGLTAQPTNRGQEINNTLRGSFRSEANGHAGNSLQFSIDVRIVDIRPDGQLVLKGDQTMVNGDEKWVRTLSGSVKPEDVLPNGTILSEKVSELSICRQEPAAVVPASANSTSNSK